MYRYALEQNIESNEIRDDFLIYHIWEFRIRKLKYELENRISMLENHYPVYEHFFNQQNKSN